MEWHIDDLKAFLEFCLIWRIVFVLLGIIVTLVSILSLQP